MIEKLKKFCGDPRYSERIGSPWSKGKFTFATNGYILVRVPRLQEVPEREDAVNVGAVLKVNPEPVEGFVDGPGIEGLDIPQCPRCKGNESEPQEFEECDGSGVVNFENSFHEYECTCQSCDGDGELDHCRKCHGTGYLIDSEEALIDIAGALFKKTQILDLTRVFGSLQIAPPCPEGKASWIRFQDGQALVMPVIRAQSA